jgi:signal transduction histidine kinase
LSLLVRDDGVGLPERVDDPTRRGGSGIRNLRERAEMTGGVFAVTAAFDGGTAVRITWALAPDEVCAPN